MHRPSLAALARNTVSARSALSRSIWISASGFRSGTHLAPASTSISRSMRQRCSRQHCPRTSASLTVPNHAGPATGIGSAVAGLFDSPAHHMDAAMSSATAKPPRPMRMNQKAALVPEAQFQSWYDQAMRTPGLSSLDRDLLGVICACYRRLHAEGCAGGLGLEGTAPRRRPHTGELQVPV